MTTTHRHSNYILHLHTSPSGERSLPHLPQFRHEPFTHALSRSVGTCMIQCSPGPSVTSELAENSQPGARHEPGHAISKLSLDLAWHTVCCTGHRACTGLYAKGMQVPPRVLAPCLCERGCAPGVPAPGHGRRVLQPQRLQAAGRGAGCGRHLPALQVSVYVQLPPGRVCTALPWVPCARCACAPACHVAGPPTRGHGFLGYKGLGFSWFPQPKSPRAAACWRGADWKAWTGGSIACEGAGEG